MNTPWVVVRCWNDVQIVGETLSMIRRQSQPCRIIVFDNESTDGSAEICADAADKFVNVPAGTYVPGRVLNHAMRETAGEFVVFVNSDCTPQNEHWLAELLAGFRRQEICAVFGRQIPRPDCLPLFARDTETTFGDGRDQQRWRHCFSMASSAVRRSVWEEIPFREDITYSEDIDWTWRARQTGWEIRYAPRSVVSHSHNYTLRQFHKRQFGEGRAEAAIFEWDDWQKSLLRYSLLPFGRQVLGDLKYAVKSGMPSAALHSPALRFAQMTGRRRGFVQGLREKEQRA